MILLLDDTRQVFFPGSVIYGAFCVKECTGLDPNRDVPDIKTSGYTLIWKQGANKVIDEYSLFFEDKAELCSEGDNIILNNELTKNYSTVFYFHVVLPDNLPPSHEVPFGHTRYKIQAYYNNQTVFKYFSVNQWVGLEKRNDKIVKYKKNKLSLFSCFQSIEVELILNQMYYLPGETVYAIVMITNNSWKDIIFSKINITQTTKYQKSHHIMPTKHTRVIAEKTRGQIRRGERQIWHKQPLYIPAVIPTTNIANNRFNFFEIKYKMEINIFLNNSKKKRMLKQNVFIGNWDKSKDSKKCAEMSSNNDLPTHEIMVKECFLIQQEDIDFVPKYVIYETRQL